jgi:UPF0755 protein
LTDRRSGALPRFLIGLGIFLSILVVGAGAAVWQLDRLWHQPGQMESEQIVDLPRGAGIVAIAEQLAARQIIPSSYLFLAGLVWDGGSRNLRAGEYAFPAHISMAELAALLRSGRVVQHRLTIPEGWTVVEIMEAVLSADFLTGPLPDPVPDEGTLRPDTYFAEKGADRRTLITRMVQAQSALVADVIAHRPAGVPAPDPHKLLVLASLVERESAIAEERPMIAGVFTRRLERNMRLQSDPTVIYGLSGRRGSLDRDLTRDDLKSPSPWNTYVIDGLPATPICNPGLSALQAAVAPDQGDALYFVANGDGGHQFAATLAAHNHNVALWREKSRKSDH